MIEVKNLSRYYDLPKKKKIIALNNVSFEIGDGKIIGLIGENGAGKSTLIKVLTGILFPSDGTCFVDNIEPYKNRKRNAKNIGIMFGQRSQLWWDLPLIDTFSVLKTIYDINPQNYDFMYNFLLNEFNLFEIINQPIRTLSLGQRIRCEIACTLLHQPKIVYLDEPTIGLDVLMKNRIRNALLKYKKIFNSTIILASHDVNDIESICDELLMLDKGNLIFHGSKELFFEKYNKKIMIKLIISNENELQLNDNIIHKFKINSYEVNHQTIKIVVDNAEEIPDILSYFSNKLEVISIEVLRNSLEEIIGEIYDNKK